MSTPLYDALVAKVRDWSNRDTESLPDSVLKDSLDYASETAYRELRIQGMEKVFKFEANAKGNTFDVPSDLKEFISVRQIKTVNQNVAGTETFSFTAEANQTLFSEKDKDDKTLTYVAGSILVTLNGVFLDPSTDYTASNGLSISLNSAAFEGDVLNVVAFNSIVDSASVKTFLYTATSGQTVFTGVDTNNKTLSYKLNRVLVTKNGIFLTNGVDYTATNKTSITLTSGAALDDEIKIVSFQETSVYSSNVSTVERNEKLYENRSDYRSFVNEAGTQYARRIWTRQADKILVHPEFVANDSFEIYYYSDGSDLGTEYAVTSANFQAGLLENSDSDGVQFTSSSTGVTALYFLSSASNPPVADEDVPSENSGGSYTTAYYFKGKEQPHHLRDNQERLLIYLSLSFINDYLGENNESMKYYQKASELIQRLNNAEVFKESSGGNIRVNFDGPLI